MKILTFDTLEKKGGEQIKRKKYIAKHFLIPFNPKKRKKQKNK